MDKRPHFQLNSRTACSSLPISASRTPCLPSICFISFFVTFLFSASVPRRHQFPSVRHLFRGLHSESPPPSSRDDATKHIRTIAPSFTSPRTTACLDGSQSTVTASSAGLVAVSTSAPGLWRKPIPAATGSQHGQHVRRIRTVHE